MPRALRVAVCSRSFSSHPILRAELLEAGHTVTFNDAGASMDGAGLAAFLRGHDAAVVGLERIDEALLSAVPELSVIAKFGVGVDALDLDAMGRHEVRLGWTPGVNRRAVAELFVSVTIALLRHVPEASRAASEGRWERFIGTELSGRTVGIVGLGNVGQDVVRLLAPFGCRVLATDVRDRSSFAARHGVELVDLDALVSQSEIVTLHVPRDATTVGLMGERRLRAMRRGALLVNLARGGLVDEAALVRALDEGHLAGAALDVLDVEPPSDLAVVSHPKILATPHIGGSSADGILAMGRAAIAGLASARAVSEIDFFEVR